MHICIYVWADVHIYNSGFTKVCFAVVVPLCDYLACSLGHRTPIRPRSNGSSFYFLSVRLSKISISLLCSLTRGLVCFNFPKQSLSFTNEACASTRRHPSFSSANRLFSRSPSPPSLLRHSSDASLHAYKPRIRPSQSCRLRFYPFVQ